MKTADQPAPASAVSGVFLSTLAAMNGGQVVTDLDDALREATRAANDAKMKSKVTLELTIVPNGEGIGGVSLFRVEDKIKVSLPKPPRETKSVFFADGENNLTRRNPRQEELRLEALEGGKAPTLKNGASPQAAAGQ